MNAPLTLSLFPGIGLLDMAFEEEGFAVVRGPDLIFGGDIKRFHPPAGRFDGVIGGPPCQAFSSLRHLVKATGGKVAENLIPEFERVVAEASPSWFLMENVPDAPEPVVAGFVVRSLILNNRWVPDGETGAEQNRVRRFSFGTRDGRALKPHVALWECPRKSVAVLASSGGGTCDPGYRNDRKRKVRGGAIRKGAAILGDKVVPVPTVMTAPGPARLEGGHGDSMKRDEDGKPVRKDTAMGERVELLGERIAPVGTVTANGTTWDAEKQRPRSFRSEAYFREACRLQGLPEGFDIPPFTVEAKIKAVGNGVPLPLGRAVARAVREALEDARGGAA